MHKTDIVTTLDPKTQTVEKIGPRIYTRLNVARIHLFHGAKASHAHLINRVKEARSITMADTAFHINARSHMYYDGASTL